MNLSIRTSLVRLQERRNELRFYCDLDRDLDPTYYYTVKWYQSDGTSLIRFIWASDPLKFDGNFREETALGERIFVERGHKLGIRVRKIRFI